MKSKLVLIVAIILGVFAAALVYFYLNGISTKMEKMKYIDIIVASGDIERHTVLTESVLMKKKIAIDSKHPLSVTEGKDLIGKVALIDLSKGEEILTNQVIKIGESQEGLSYAIPVGRRAMAVAVDDITGVGGMIKPGDRIDVIATLAGNEENPINYTAIVVQDIQVLAVGTTLEGIKATSDTKAPEKKTVTLAVTMDEAMKLKMSIERGVISLMLRPPTDKEIEELKPITTDAILSSGGSGNIIGKGD